MYPLNDNFTLRPMDGPVVSETHRKRHIWVIWSGYGKYTANMKISKCFLPDRNEGKEKPTTNDNARTSLTISVECL